ncbi:MAG: hypothetical protein KAS77_09305, partial [Thermoplasmata archaeon]|nr:hypothetical protein [Thermoplasmata archaeon]
STHNGQSGGHPFIVWSSRITLVGGMVNIGQIPDQVPEPINERVQESVWSIIANVLIGLPDVFFALTELLVSIL